MGVNIKIAVFWNVMSGSLIGGYQHFGGPAAPIFRTENSTLKVEAAGSFKMLIPI
jgi:hypothetical protein